MHQTTVGARCSVVIIEKYNTARNLNNKHIYIEVLPKEKFFYMRTCAFLGFSSLFSVLVCVRARLLIALLTLKYVDFDSYAHLIQHEWHT